MHILKLSMDSMELATVLIVVAVFNFGANERILVVEIIDFIGC